MQVRRGGPVNLPDVTLVAVAAPEVLRTFSPAKPKGFVLPLVIGAAQHEAVLGPDDRRAPMRSGVIKDARDRRPFLAGHGNVEGAINAGQQVACPAPAERLPLVGGQGVVLYAPP